jgi:hypothetical protein
MRYAACLHRQVNQAVPFRTLLAKEYCMGGHKDTLTLWSVPGNQHARRHVSLFPPL